MAKDQGLSLNPTKISGTCGRLMCCLKYENEAYQDLLKNTPPNESLVDTPYGRGTVMDASLLRGTCRVRMMNSPDAPVTVPCDQCTVLRRGRDKGEPLPDLPAPPKPQPLPGKEVHLVDSVEEQAAEKPQGEAQGERKGQRRNDRNDRNRRGGKPQGDKAKPQTQGDKPKNQNDKPKKDKPIQQNAKPAEGEKAPKADSGEHKRRHRGGRRNHRGGSRPQGDKAQAPKTE